ncbi:MAG: hypothetical protein KA109_17535 [Saprospiraceae bacterium]|nr:hypothetical protein [Saprospiraceae bacterium]MBP7923880.1 hypothetical protein [Saprospiraceae bacterium]MBP8094799.1 hypothetical protein [Saprospiraceae bacterium]
MRSFTIVYLLFFSLTSISQNSDTVIHAHGTFIYFAKCKDGVICVSDSRVTETRRDYFGESKSYTDNNIKIYNHDGIIFAFSNQLNIGNLKIWDLLEGFSMPCRLQNNILTDFYSRLISLDGGDTYIKNGNIFIAGMSENGKLFFCRSFLENKSLVTYKTDEKYLTNRPDYDKRINFNLKTMDEAFEIIQDEIQTYSSNVDEIGGKLIGFKLYNDGKVNSIENGKIIVHFNLAENFDQLNITNQQNYTTYNIQPYSESLIVTSLMSAPKKNITTANIFDQNIPPEVIPLGGFSIVPQSKIEDFSSFISNDKNLITQNQWDLFINPPNSNLSKLTSNSILNIEGMPISKFDIDPNSKVIDFSLLNNPYSSAMPITISPFQNSSFKVLRSSN